MIFENILNVLFDLSIRIFEVLPDISWSVDNSALPTFLGFISVIMYILPMNTITSLLGVVFSLILTRFAIAFVKSLWDLIPFL